MRGDVQVVQIVRRPRDDVPGGRMERAVQWLEERSFIMLILVPVDTSPMATRVRDTAVDLATHVGAELLFLRVISDVEGAPHSFMVPPLHQLAETLRKEAQDELNALIAPIAASLKARARVQSGTPWREIVREAADAHAEMVVIGAHSAQPLDGLLGSTATRVVNHAPCDVLVVRPAKSG